EMVKGGGGAQEAAEERVLDTHLPKPRVVGLSTDEPAQPRNGEAREKLRRMLEAHELEDREIEIELRALPMGVEIMAPPGMEEMQQQLQSMFQNLGGNRTRTRKQKSTRLNSSHQIISYAVFCLKKKNKQQTSENRRKYTHS